MTATNIRMTPIRRQVIETLKKFHRPATVQEIAAAIEKNDASADLATIYRTLNLLVKHRLIEKIDFQDGKYHYEWQAKHHHHLICTNCGQIKELEGELLSISTKNIEKKTKYKVLGHSLEFFGLCQLCQKQ